MPILKKLNDDDRRKILEQVVDEWNDWKTGRQEKELVWDDCYRHYLCQIDKSAFDAWPWRSSVSLPTSQEIGDSIKASMKNALFPDNEDFFEAEGLDPIGQMSFRGIPHTTFVEKRLKNIITLTRFVNRFDPFLLQLAILGNSHAQLPWREFSRPMKRWQFGKIAEMPGLMWKGPRLETHSMYNVVFDPMLTEYSQDATRIIRELKDADYLKDNSDVYENFDNLDNKKPPDAHDSAEKERRRLFGMNPDAQMRKRENEIELLTRIGDMKVRGETFHDCIVTVVNRNRLVRFDPQPYFCGQPQIFADYNTMVAEHLGRGPLEPVRGLQFLADTFTNQNVDILNLIIGGFFAVGRDGLLDPEFVVQRPYGLVPIDDVNNIKPLHPTANPALAMAEINNLKLEMEESSGASKAAKGIMAPGRRTATEALQVHAGSSNRFNDIVAHVGEMAVEPALNMMLAMDFQFNYPNTNILPPQAWEGSYYIHFRGAKNTAIRELAMQQFAMFTDIVTRNPLFIQFTNPPEFVKEWQKLLNIKNSNLTRTQPLSSEFPEIAQMTQGGGNNGSMPGAKRPSIGPGARV